MRASDLKLEFEQRRWKKSGREYYKQMRKTKFTSFDLRNCWKFGKKESLIVSSLSFQVPFTATLVASAVIQSVLQQSVFAR